MTNTYNLVAYIPYEGPDHLFSGTEDELREFIQKNKGTKPYTFMSGKKIESPAVAGYLLDDLEVTIDGPDVRHYLE